MFCGGPASAIYLCPLASTPVLTLLRALSVSTRFEQLRKQIEGVNLFLPFHVTGQRLNREQLKGWGTGSPTRPRPDTGNQ